MLSMLARTATGVSLLRHNGVTRKQSQLPSAAKALQCFLAMHSTSLAVGYDFFPVTFVDLRPNFFST